MTGGTSEAAIRFHGVSKAYDGVQALDGLDLEVPRGEILGLLGPNGAGKTTAIKVLMGLVRRDAGELEVLGRHAPGPGVLPTLGYMPQETALYPDLTVAEHLELFADLYGLPRPHLHDRARELLELVDLAAREHEVTANLSGGMRNRLSLAIALLHDPDVLVLDEPTVGVDPVLRARLWDRFRALRDAGKSLLVTTHYLDEARYCDRIALLHRGRVLAHGTRQDVLDAVGAQDLEEVFRVLARQGGSDA